MGLINRQKTRERTLDSQLAGTQVKGDAKRLLLTRVSSSVTPRHWLQHRNQRYGNTVAPSTILQYFVVGIPNRSHIFCKEKATTTRAKRKPPSTSSMPSTSWPTSSTLSSRLVSVLLDGWATERTVTIGQISNHSYS